MPESTMASTLALISNLRCRQYVSRVAADGIFWEWRTGSSPSFRVLAHHELPESLPVTLIEALVSLDDS